MTNLSICQDCGVNPATYGDGVIWSRCSACQLRNTQTDQPQKVQLGNDADKFEHKTIPGLTSIILPVYLNNYSLFHYTGNCIGSVREHTDKEKTPYEIVIVDNGSSIKVPTLNTFYADKVITHTENLGVSVAWNKGIRVSFGEYIVLLNNDTQVFTGWLEELKRVIDEEGFDLVMASPMYSLTEPFARAVESKKVLEGKYIFDKVAKDFSCVMFKKSLFDEIGEFDEQFFNYCSDADYFRRLDQAGKKYKVVDKVAIHHISDATGASMEDTPQIMNEDKAKFEEKWNRPQIEVIEPFDLKPEIGEEQLPGFTAEQEARFIRTNETGDKIYLKKENQVHWIKNPEALEALDGHFGDEVTITKEEFDKLERGEPIDTYNVKRYV